MCTKLHTAGAAPIQEWPEIHDMAVQKMASQPNSPTPQWSQLQGPLGLLACLMSAIARGRLPAHAPLCATMDLQGTQSPCTATEQRARFPAHGHGSAESLFPGKWPPISRELAPPVHGPGSAGHAFPGTRPQIRREFASQGTATDWQGACSLVHRAHSPAHGHASARDPFPST